ncbi:MAG: T9SS type A sorting domain-containing protein [candidate division Zixibacteria bacterium]|nr:T9SS type A sorting domain-containing protein [candidate division Zixibacteria bacterium]
MIRLVLLIVVLFASTLKATDILAVYGEQVSARRGMLVWFCEGINLTGLSYDDCEMDGHHYVSEQDLQNRSAISYDLTNLPVFFREVKVFLPPNDFFPGQPGDQSSPFYVGLNRDAGGYPGDYLYGPVQADVPDEWSLFGQWVSRSTERLITTDSLVWITVKWKPETPGAPVIGFDYTDSPLRSLAGYFDGSLNWVPLSGGNIMVRGEYLANDLKGDLMLDSGATVPDSFRIYSAGVPTLTADDVYYDTTVVGNLHARVKLDYLDNYFILTAFKNEIESSASSRVHIPGTYTPRAVIDFDPDQLDIILPNVCDTAFELILQNENGGDIDYRVTNWSMLELKRSDAFDFDIYPKSGRITNFDEDTLRIEFSLDQAQLGRFKLIVRFEFEDSVSIYQDEEFEINLQIDQLTSADDEFDEVLPQDFYLGHNYPNPFNSRTVIPYTNNTGSVAQLEIYDLLGRLVAHFPLKPAKTGLLTIDLENLGRKKISSGIYFYRIREMRSGQVCKMSYLK